MNDLNTITQPEIHPMIKLATIAMGVYALNKIFGGSNDTVNYSLWHKRKLVYHGICYADRLNARLNEHEISGKKYDEFDHDHSKPRDQAAQIEKRLIQRDRPKYNYQHNY